jgi:hypothetical protein
MRAVRDGASEEHEHPKDDPSSIAHIVESTRQEARTPLSAAQKCSYLGTYINLVQTSDTAVDSIAEIDVNPCV